MAHHATDEKAAPVLPAAENHTISAALTTSVDKREIGGEAVWTLSSAKSGNGVEQLRDDSTETFWQSDGPQPHLINIQFHKKTKIQEVCLYVDYKLDESYTPSEISIRAGTAAFDLHEIHAVTLDEPIGWVTIPLNRKTGAAADDKSNAAGGGAGAGGEVLRAHLLQIAVKGSHQNGRDTHIRQIKIFAPRQSAADAQTALAAAAAAAAAATGIDDAAADDKAAAGGSEPAMSVVMPSFSTLEFQQFTTLR